MRLRRPILAPAVGVLALLLLIGSTAGAQSWQDVVVPEKTYDFGTVARGSKLRHAFRIVNTTSYDIHIYDWRTKCGCTDVKVGARDIPPGTQTTVEATLDTTKFQGAKASGLILIFDRPQYAEVDLNMNCFIRGDVMLNPGSVDFQNVPRGSTQTHTLHLSYYGGEPDWGVTEIKTLTSAISAELRPLGRDAQGISQFQLTTTILPNAPVGYLKEEVTLITNDPTSPTIPISVTANVQAAVTVAPAVLSLGRLQPGQSVQKMVLVKSNRPFKVTGASCAKPDLTATADLGEARPFHPVQVRFKAPSQPGPYNATLEIASDLPDEPPAKLTVFATIVGN